MIAVVQRVGSASVNVAEDDFRETIELGLCVFLGIEHGDGSSQATWMSRKLAQLRIFNDDDGKMNKSVNDVGGEILLVSQFTLAGDCTAGNRPSFVHAAEPEVAKPLVELVAHQLMHEYSVPVKQGVFGASMHVDINNDGPVTLILRRD